MKFGEFPHTRALYYYNVIDLYFSQHLMPESLNITKLYFCNGGFRVAKV